MNEKIIISPKQAYIFISVLIIMAVSWSVFKYPLYTFYYGADFWEHSATIHEWTRDLWHPGNPHLAIDTGSPRYMPFFFLLTVLAKIFDLNSIQVLGIGGILSTIFFLYGVWLFMPLYFRNDWAAFVGLIVLLCGWGVAWYWSNCYQLRCLFYIITYPSTFVFSVCFLYFWLATIALRKQAMSFWNLVSLGIMSALMFLSHPLSGVFAIGSICLLALSEPKVSFSHRLTLIVVVFGGALAAELWPYFSVWRVVLGTSGGEGVSWLKSGNFIGHGINMLYHTHPFYKPKQLLVALGPGLVGIPSLFYMVYKREQFFIIFGFIIMSVPFVANLFLPIPLGHRFLFYMIFYLHLALIWGILKMQSNIRKATHQNTFVGSARITRGALFCFLTMCLLWNVALSVLEFTTNYRLEPDLKLNSRERAPIVDDMRRLSFIIPDEAIVMAPETLSWPLPTFTGKVVALFHMNPMVVDEYQRHKDNERFFQSETTQEDRLKILRRYNVTHILFKSKDIAEKLRKNLSEFGTVAGEINDNIVIKIEPAHK